jgi:hypothetical protein
MANLNFEKSNHVWKVQVGSQDFEHEREHWGDEYNWNSIAPILWGTIDHPRIRIQPPKAIGDIYPIVSWWQGALHLLGHGLGWADFAKGLDEWRSAGYPTENHVLRAVYNTYGPSIEGLEVWMKASHDFWGTMENIGYGNRVTLKTWESSRVDVQRNALKEILNSGPRHQLTENLLSEGGNDILHLTGHYPGTFQVGEMDDPAWFYDERKASVVLENFRGWSTHALRGLEMFYGSLDQVPGEISIEVHVVGQGFLGRFSLSKETGRLFRNSYGSSTVARDLRWHLAGN